MTISLKEGESMSSITTTDANRWTLISGGAATLIFGIAAVFWPGLTTLVLIYLFSAFALIIGVINVINGLGTADDSDSWFLSVILGAFEVGVGVYILRHTGVKFTTLIVLIGFVLIASGIVDAIEAYFNEALNSKNRAISYLCGIAGLVSGIIILFTKAKSGVSFVWILGLYAIVVGTLQISSLSDRSR